MTIPLAIAVARKIPAPITAVGTFEGNYYDSLSPTVQAQVLTGIIGLVNALQDEGYQITPPKEVI